MGNNPLVRTALCEDDSVRTGAATCVNLVAVQYRKFIVRSAGWEVEPFVVIVLVRVASRVAAGVQVRAALGDCVIDVRLIVTSATAGIDALTASD